MKTTLDEKINIRMSTSHLDQIDELVAKHEYFASRSDVIRWLIAFGPQIMELAQNKDGE